jgi:hypothetical protein
MTNLWGSYCTSSRVCHSWVGEQKMLEGHPAPHYSFIQSRVGAWSTGKGYCIAFHSRYSGAVSQNDAAGWPRPLKVFRVIIGAILVELAAGWQLYYNSFLLVLTTFLMGESAVSILLGSKGERHHKVKSFILNHQSRTPTPLFLESQRTGSQTKASKQKLVSMGWNVLPEVTITPAQQGYSHGVGLQPIPLDSRGEL